MIFNKGAVMVLPPGINKATGLQAALEDLKLSAHNVVGVGDAENDIAFLTACGCSVAVGNALASVKGRAEVVTDGARGAGVVEIAERLLARPRRRGADRRNVGLRQVDAGAGDAGAAERRDYQFCIIDPEGDYDQLANAFTVGSQEQPPAMSQVMDPRANIAVNLLAIPLRERPDCFTDLLSRLLQLRLRRGRPHWIVVDEAHHMVSPSAAAHAWSCRAALEKVRLVMAVGEAQDATISTFARQTGRPVPRLPKGASSPHTMMVWNVEMAEARVLTRPVPKGERRRHIRKYAEGQLGADKSFYFRGPDDRLNLRAHNLSMFMQLAEGVDDATWLHHLRQGDYSRWFRDAIKDSDLARQVQEAEAAFQADASASRARIFTEIERRYTAPAAG